MSKLYPTLEDMKVHQIQEAQITAASFAAASCRSDNNYPPAGAIAPTTDTTDLAMVYPSLMQEYMGLKLEPPSGAFQPTNQQSTALYPAGRQNELSAMGRNSLPSDLMVAPLSYGDLGMKRANTTHSIREVFCCKDEAGKFGLRLKDIDKGLFVQFVQQGSPAALVGLRFGDQILQIDAQNMAGVTSDQAFKILAKLNAPRISFVVRDRPFERTVTLHKDSHGHTGFTHDDGLIKGLVKDSSAARNGLLIDHYVLEVNGQNVVGLKSKQLADIIEKSGQIITLTIMPKFVYEHIVKCMSDNIVKKFMDRSVPEVY